MDKVSRKQKSDRKTGLGNRFHQLHGHLAKHGGRAGTMGQNNNHRSKIVRNRMNGNCCHIGAGTFDLKRQGLSRPSGDNTRKRLNNEKDKILHNDEGESKKFPFEIRRLDV